METGKPLVYIHIRRVNFFYPFKSIDYYMQQRERGEYSLGQKLTLAFRSWQAEGSWSNLFCWIPKLLICALPLLVCCMIKHKHFGLLSFKSFTSSQQSFVGIFAFPVAYVRQGITFWNPLLHSSFTPPPAPSTTLKKLKPERKIKKTLNRQKEWLPISLYWSSQLFFPLKNFRSREEGKLSYVSRQWLASQEVDTFNTRTTAAYVREGPTIV